MKFLVDAQLPYTLREWLVKQGYNAVHTKDLQKGNATDDLEVIRVAESEQRIIISKDSDFIKLHILSGRPSKVLAITTGNIINSELMELFKNNFSTLLNLIKTHQIVEIDNTSIKGH
jgi:predicted nuclease of predicted toxin-antitoxin system